MAQPTPAGTASANPNPSPNPSPIPNPNLPPANAASAAPTAEPPRGLDAAQLSAELARHDGELQRCHQDVVVAALMKAPQGGNLPELGVLELDVTLHVAPSGQVRSADVRGDGPESLARCISEVAQRFSFPRAERESEARVPIVFTPNIVRQ